MPLRRRKVRDEGRKTSATDIRPCLTVSGCPRALAAAPTMSSMTGPCPGTRAPLGLRFGPHSQRSEAQQPVPGVLLRVEADVAAVERQPGLHVLRIVNGDRQCTAGVEPLSENADRFAYVGQELQRHDGGDRRERAETLQGLQTTCDEPCSPAQCSCARAIIAAEEHP